MISLIRAPPLFHIQINLGRLLVAVILRRDLKSCLTVLLHLNLFETGPDTSRNVDYDANFHNSAPHISGIEAFPLCVKVYLHTETTHFILYCSHVVWSNWRSFLSVSRSIFC